MELNNRKASLLGEMLRLIDATLDKPDFRDHASAVLATSRQVMQILDGEELARTERALFLRRLYELRQGLRALQVRLAGPSLKLFNTAGLGEYRRHLDALIVQVDRFSHLLMHELAHENSTKPGYYAFPKTTSRIALRGGVSSPDGFEVYTPNSELLTVVQTPSEADTLIAHLNRS